MTKKLLIVLACMINLGIGYLYLAPARTRPIWDLPQFYFAAKLVRAGQVAHLYDRLAYVPLTAELQIADARAAKYSIYFNRPAFEAPLFLPLAFFSYRTAGFLIVVVNFGLLALLAWKLPDWLGAPADSRIWLFVFMPFLHSIAFGQDTLLLTLLVGLGLHLILKERELPAGVILALAAFKPHLLCAIPFALIAARKWKALCAFISTGGVLALLSFSLVGVRGMRDWIDLLRAPSTDAVPLLMGNVRALALHWGAPAGIAAAVLAVACFCIILKYSPFPQTFSAALLTGLLLGPHTYLQDYSLVAIVALTAFHPAMRYLLLLPWPYFYPSNNLVPFIVLALIYLVYLAAKPAIEWCGLCSLKMQSLQPLSTQECNSGPGR